MKIYQIVLAVILVSFANMAKAQEVPPPGTAREGTILVDPYDRGSPSKYSLKTHKTVPRAAARKFNLSKKAEVERLKRRIAELEDQLRNRPVATANIPVQYPKSRAQPVEQVVRVESKKNRVSAIAGWGPESLDNDRKNAQDGNQIGFSNGPVVGGQYQRLLGDTISVGVLVTVPTVPDTKKPTYAASLGFDF